MGSTLSRLPPLNSKFNEWLPMGLGYGGDTREVVAGSTWAEGLHPARAEPFGKLELHPLDSCRSFTRTWDSVSGVRTSPPECVIWLSPLQEEVPFPAQKSKRRMKPQLVFNRPPVVSPPSTPLPFCK